MKKFCLLLITLLCLSVTVAPIYAAGKKPGKDAAKKADLNKKAKNNDASNKKEDKKNTTKKDKKKKDEEKKFTKIFIPGHETKEIQVQGIAYLPGDDMKMSNGEPRYILLSYYPNLKLKKTANTASQIIVIDRESKEKNKAIRRFALYKNTKEGVKKAIEKGRLASSKVYLNDIFDDTSTLTNTDTSTDTSDDTNSDTGSGTESDTKDDTDTSVSADTKDANEGENDEAAESKKEQDKEKANEKSDKAYKLLPFRGHCGGIAVAGKYLWVSSAFALRGYEIDDIKESIKDENNKEKLSEKGLPDSIKSLPGKKLFRSQLFLVDSKGSFLSFDGKKLWVGEYYNPKSSSKYSKKPVEHHKKLFDIPGSRSYSWVSGYNVDENGCPTAKDTYPVYHNKVIRENRLKPDAVISIRKRMQGMAMIGEDMFVLSKTQGTKNSYLIFYYMPKNAESKTYKAQNNKKFTVDAYDTNNKNTKKNKKRFNLIKRINKKIPSQIQDLEYDGKYIYAPFTSKSKIWTAKHKKGLKSKNLFLINVEKLGLDKKKKDIQTDIDGAEIAKEAAEEADKLEKELEEEELIEKADELAKKAEELKKKAEDLRKKANDLEVKKKEAEDAYNKYHPIYENRKTAYEFAGGKSNKKNKYEKDYKEAKEENSKLKKAKDEAGKAWKKADEKADKAEKKAKEAEELANKAAELKKKAEEEAKNNPDTNTNTETTD